MFRKRRGTQNGLEERDTKKASVREREYVRVCLCDRRAWTLTTRADACGCFVRTKGLFPSLQQTTGTTGIPLHLNRFVASRERNRKGENQVRLPLWHLSPPAHSPLSPLSFLLPFSPSLSLSFSCRCRLSTCFSLSLSFFVLLTEERERKK